MSVLTLEQIKRVSFVDDEHDELILRQAQLRRLGMEVVPIQGPIASVNELIQQIQNGSEACICDNSLQPKNFANFFGAEPVAKLNQSGYPALLVTQFQMDQDVSMREWRRHMPVVLSKEEADSDRIAQGFEFCLREFAGQIASHRKPTRTILEVL